MDLEPVARRVGAEVRSATQDGGGWRWRAAWRGVELGAWNDMDGVAIVTDIGPWDEWVGLDGHPPDPTPAEALEFAIGVVGGWLETPENASRIARRSAERRGRVGRAELQ